MSHYLKTLLENKGHPFVSFGTNETHKPDNSLAENIYNMLSLTFHTTRDTFTKQCYLNITEKDLSNYYITYIPPEIGALNNLEYLSLSHNLLKRIPPEIGALTNLTILYLTNNKLATLPPEIGQLINLTQLGLGENKLKHIPPEICRLTKLTHLALHHNSLKRIPPEILGSCTHETLANLTHLYLDHNKLKHISIFIKLNELTLNNNQLKWISSEPFKKEFAENTIDNTYFDDDTIQRSDLYYNQLKWIPYKITHFQKLYIYNNQIIICLIDKKNIINNYELIYNNDI